MPHRDGTNGSGADAAYLKNTPIEVTETETPVEFVKYGLARDSGGPGRWRGGLATEMAFRVFAPDSRVTARNREPRELLPSLGVLGGRAAGLSDMMVNPGTPHAKRLGNIDTVVLQPGDVLEIPLGRWRGTWRSFREGSLARGGDVRRGYVSPEAAEKSTASSFATASSMNRRRPRLRTGRAPPHRAFSFRPGNAKATRRSGMLRRTPSACGPRRSADPLALLHEDPDFPAHEGTLGRQGVEAAFDEVCARFSRVAAPFTSSRGGSMSSGGRILRLSERDRAIVSFYLDGEAVTALAGDTVQTAVLSVVRGLRRSEFGPEERAGFCLMGPVRIAGSGRRPGLAYAPARRPSSRDAAADQRTNGLAMSAPMAGQVVIVGAGPAGIRAAETLVAAGLHPVVVDEGRRPADRSIAVRRTVGPACRRSSMARTPERPLRFMLSSTAWPPRGG